jgi:hypothetical protein
MMSTRALAVVVVFTALLLGAVAITAQTLRPGETMQLWEYRTEITRERGVGVPAETRGDSRREGGPTDSMLNSRGREGWELVAVTRREIRVDDTLQTETLYTFKRSTRSVNR